MMPPTPDDELGLALSAVLATADPVPDHVLAAARATFAWRDIDAALAELTSDSLTASGVAVRGTPPRLLTFTAGAITVDLEVTDESGTVRVLGQIAPGQRAGVVIEHADGSARSSRTDAMGRFAVDGLPAGWMRVGVTIDDPAGATDAAASTDTVAAPSCHTEWFKA